MTSYAHIRETEVRDALPIGAKLVHDEFTIIALGRFHPGREGEYPSIEAILAREPHDAPFPDRPYSVHRIVAVCTRGNICAPKIKDLEIINGIYDLTLGEAKQILDEQ